MILRSVQNEDMDWEEVESQAKFKILAVINFFNKTLEKIEIDKGKMKFRRQTVKTDKQCRNRHR